jgi:uncharacterized membrane protein YdjX (TVP38/TMEM64 family)
MGGIERLRAAATPQRIALALLLFGMGAGVLLLARRSGANLTPGGVRELLEPIGVWGIPALIAALTLLLIIPMVPASILQIGAGLAFGPAVGLLCTLLADLLGAGIGFWVARRWGRTLLERRLSAANRATLDRLAGRMTWRSVMLLRLLPGPAYPLVSFAAGYSTIGFGAYAAASLIGSLPSLALLAYAGDLVLREPLLAFGLVALLVGGLAFAGRLVSRGTKKENHE